MNREVWVASGHASGFADPLIDCRSCKERFRADQLIETYLEDKEKNPVCLSTHGQTKRWEFF
jgi:glycyl-tRNA synthetase